MPQTIVNLALPVVTEKINVLLLGYPFYPYQQTFASPAVRERLVAYVLSRIPGFYVSMDHVAACSLESPGNCYSAEQHQQIEQLIHQGIEHLLNPRQAWGSSSRLDPSDSAFLPSSWFG
ncbi:MAG: hypothetical protein ICV77_07475 [Cyanobacteria bacterium Co-bin8]|nr:hypothetical protein [Cyanobacteria bacterium Co-bin8]